MRRILFLLPLAVACSASSTEPGSGLETSVSLSSGIVTPGDTITVHLTLSNPTSHGIEVTTGNSCFVTFTVQPLGQAEVPADPRACATVITTIFLRPGERRRVAIEWDLTVANTPLPLGQYSIRGGIPVPNQSGLDASSAPMRLQVAVFGR